ncbi:choloylglycine hydrolase family protein [Ochrobactrum pecoris]|uniref:Choloylglycine hydrolase n=1 Tax=Brucella pecoris TaxID=867683 RepID=A0A5C5CEK5_9HYPH|nr:choloylglycine hydrolase family protein [Brucella pecoris]MBB4094116.1 choloylglycine hydrolase [Brucella pecoris]NKW79928.1 choloylglycine hydrolase family protein [Brucella pecoris]TNV09484.1 choloylglycine hydrolase family protein [Brucella pecoris]
MKMKQSIWKSYRQILARGVATALIGIGLVVPQAAFACTSFVLSTTDNGYVYARTMEFAFELKSDLVVIPRKYQITSTAAQGKPGMKWKGQYAAVGMNAFGLPALTDGMNEKGLSGGVLYFPDFAKYQDPATAKPENSIAPWDFLSWALTNFATVEEVKAALNSISVIDVKQNDLGIAPPVHYTLHDATGASIVIEPVDGKLKVYDNPLGVMTNSPNFEWHMTNLRNYVNLSPENAKPLVINKATFQPLGQGSGLHGVPGDTTPPSRFVRVSAYVLSAEKLPSGPESVRLAEHIANNFDIPKGLIRDSSGHAPLEYTQWTAIADMKNDVYYVKTYDNQILRSVSLKDMNLDAKDLVTVKIDPLPVAPVLIEKK